MQVKKVLTILSASILAVSSLTASADSKVKTYRQALNLYENGMYERARTLFESVPGDPLCEGYAVLCAQRMKSADWEQKLTEYRSRYLSRDLAGKMDFEQALILFDDQDYEEAARLFATVRADKLPAARRPELAFKSGYCEFARGRYPEATAWFKQVESMPMSDYKAPARYALGFMAYTGKRFGEARNWFEQSALDPRFKELSDFYILDCRFMQKDYAYVLENGPRIYEDLPKERQAYLARIIAESYLVNGDKENARKYYKLASRENMSRSDYFFAGSVLYAVNDYAGAIENFTKMTERTDSLGQIANYQLGNAYIRTRNRVAALDAFKAASEVSFDANMQEDAHFNYAKLAFDLNKDTNGFASYIKKYNTSRKGDQIYGYMALALLYDRDYAGAVAAYDNIDELAPDMLSNYIKANYLRAEQLVASGAYSAAIPCLKASAYYLPHSDRLNQLSRYWLAEANYHAENYDESLKIYADLYNISALQGREEGASLSYNAAYSHFRKQEFDQAARWYDIYLNEGGNKFRKDALERRADCDFARRDYKAAIASYQKVLDGYGAADDIYPYYQQALSYGLAGDKKSKASVLSRVELASAKSPLYDEAMYELGRSYMDVNDSEKAIAAFTRLNTTTSDKTYRAKSLIGLGMVSRNIKEYQEALVYYKKVVELMPGSEYSEDALLAIESIYQTTRQPEKYLEYIETNRLDAGKSEADKEQMYFNTAEQVFLAGNYIQAAASLQKYIDSYPQGTRVDDAYFYLAESYKAMGNKEKACDLYARVMDAGKASSFTETSTLNFAELSYSLERYKAAESGYSKLFETARMEENRKAACLGMMRSAYKGRDYDAAVAACDVVKAFENLSAEAYREADYTKAKSLLGCSRRDEAMVIFRSLSSKPSTNEGAEACVILIQDVYNRGDFDAVQDLVYDFSGKAGDQSYWLAKSYIILADSFVEKGLLSQAKATYESIRDGYTPESQDDDIPGIVAAKLARVDSLSK